MLPFPRERAQHKGCEKVFKMLLLFGLNHLVLEEFSSRDMLVYDFCLDEIRRTYNNPRRELELTVRGRQTRKLPS
jgi:hypothetical protein